MDNTTQEKVFKKLGFSHIETATIVIPLNKFINNYQQFFHKMQAFHWNTVGGEFYDLHEITEKLYHQGLADIDILAERIRIFGKIPNGKIAEFEEDTTVKIKNTEMSSNFMVEEIISDIEILLSYAVEVNSNAIKNSDYGTFHVVSGIIHRLEMQHWQLSSFISRKYA